MSDQDAAEAWLGLPLPADYKHLASEYGPLDIQTLDEDDDPLEYATFKPWRP
ncbi:hypothetical protein [Kribbella sancticallisti]|uniref:hypothetical protein n=1 Tax=Kribbella sancticallisti TaxID=460087 RepID=UPI0031DE6C37